MILIGRQSKKLSKQVKLIMLVELVKLRSPLSRISLRRLNLRVYSDVISDLAVLYQSATDPGNCEPRAPAQASNPEIRIETTRSATNIESQF